MSIMRWFLIVFIAIKMKKQANGPQNKHCGQNVLVKRRQPNWSLKGHDTHSHYNAASSWCLIQTWVVISNTVCQSAIHRNRLQH